MVNDIFFQVSLGPADSRERRRAQLPHRRRHRGHRGLHLQLLEPQCKQTRSSRMCATNTCRARRSRQQIVNMFNITNLWNEGWLLNPHEAERRFWSRKCFRLAGGTLARPGPSTFLQISFRPIVLCAWSSLDIPERNYFVSLENYVLDSSFYATIRFFEISMSKRKIIE